MNCKACDTPLPEGVTFCPNCGARIEGSSSGMPTITFRPNEQPSPEAPTIVSPATQLPPAQQSNPFNLPSTATDQTVAASPFGLPSTATDQTAASPTLRLPSYDLPASQPSYSQSSGYGDIQATPPTSNAAIVSLVAGIIAWSIVPVLSAVVAIVAGHIARRDIKNSQGQLGGSGMALAGLILGYVQLGLTMVIICGVIGLVLLGLVASASS